MQTSMKPTFTQPFVLYQSPLLSAYAERLIHGFTGKPFALGGLNYPEAEIRENRERLCQHAGLNPTRLSLPKQTHSKQARLNNLNCDEAADAIILTEPDLPAMVQVADCVPVILYAPDQHIGAVIHSGWRGTAQGITPSVAQTLINEYQASPQSLIAVIGPSIGGCCYEVSDEVRDAMQTTLPNQSLSLYCEPGPHGKPFIDLQRVNQLQLAALEIQHIDIINACTRCLDEQLWSHRRGETGRQVAYLQLQP